LEGKKKNINMIDLKNILLNRFERKWDM